MIDWARVEWDDFEKLCAELLELNDFKNIEWFGKTGGDKGRDLVAVRTEDPLPGVRLQRKWLVQCKRYTRKRLTKLEIEAFFVAAKEHAPEVALLIVTTTLTPDVRDWFNTVRKQYPFEILVWEERDLEREVRRHRERLSVLPAIVRGTEDAERFYPVPSSDRFYMCNEIDDVGFYVMNAGSRAEDVRRIRQFIDFVRTTEVVFDEDDVDKHPG